MKIIEKIRHIFSKETMFNFFKKIWGKPLPPIEDMFPQIKENNENPLDAFANSEKFFKIYNKLERKLFFKRLFISLIIIFILYLSIFFLRYLYFGSELSCIGKDVCIYRGPKPNYPISVPYSAKISEDKFLILSRSRLDYYYKTIFYLTPLVYSVDIRVSFLELLKKMFEKYQYRTVEIYNVKQNRFKKINSFLSGLPEATAVDKDGNVYIFHAHDSSDSLDYFDRKKEQIVKTDLKYTSIFKNLNCAYYIKQYDVNTVLIGDSEYKCPNKFRTKDASYRTSLSALYFLNLQNFKLKKLPSFNRSDIKNISGSEIVLLPNGKLIIPIVTYKNLKINPKEISYFDELIEVYDPQKEIFILRKTNAIKDNLFQINLKNGNILYINKNSSYLFINSRNDFIKADKSETQKNIALIKKIDELAKKQFGASLDDNKLRIIKLSNTKFLLTGARSCYEHFPDPDTTKKCKQTIYFDYDKQIVKKGPDYLYSRDESKPEIEISNNKRLFAGGGNIAKCDFYECGFITTYYPNIFTQIIKFRN